MPVSKALKTCDFLQQFGDYFYTNVCFSVGSNPKQTLNKYTDLQLCFLLIMYGETALKEPAEC